MLYTHSIVILLDIINSNLSASSFCVKPAFFLASSVFTKNIDIAAKVTRNLEFGETYINREHFEAIQGFHAGVKKSGIGGADGKYGIEEYLSTQVVYLATHLE